MPDRRISFRHIPVVFLCLCTVTRAPPALAQVALDDVRGSYHGVVFDGDSRAVSVDDTALLRLYADLADAVAGDGSTPGILRTALASAAARARSSPVAADPAADGVGIGQLDVLLSAALGATPAGAAPSPHRRTLRLLRALGGDRISPRSLPQDPQVQEIVQAFMSRTAPVHVKCEGDEMPSPPDFPPDPVNGDANWTSRTLVMQDMTPIHEDTDFGTYPPTRIFFHESADPAGLCSLLLRFYSKNKGSTSEDEIELSGVICQSYNTKETCFWENRSIVNGEWTPFGLRELASDASLRQITGTWLNSASITDDINLSDSCDTCHSGQNAFVFYPNHVCPDASSKSCYGDRDNRALIKPIGYGTPVNVKAQGIVETECTYCHELATGSNEYWADYCSVIQHVIDKKLMPPVLGGIHPYAETLYWNEPIPTDNPLRDAVLELRAKCP